MHWVNATAGTVEWDVSQDDMENNAIDFPLAHTGERIMSRQMARHWKIRELIGRYPDRLPDNRPLVAMAIGTPEQEDEDEGEGQNEDENTNTPSPQADADDTFVQDVRDYIERQEQLVMNFMDGLSSTLTLAFNDIRKVTIFG
ncbi:hypothetical protein MMC18_001829 [Xylographa bjoerkii]|nr:hypothetical protein [Xylographa bjoerkii]